MNDDPVVHLEAVPGKTYCGRKTPLPAGGFFIDCASTFETIAGSRCKSCWRSYAHRNPDAESD